MANRKPVDNMLADLNRQSGRKLAKWIWAATPL